MKHNLSGKRFGRLTVLRRDDDYISSTGRHYVRWLCECDCGNETSVNTDALIRGKTRSCGCLKRELSAERNITHGDTNSRLYAIWCAMKSRCLNSNAKAYKDYGGRGITICEEWKNSYESFREWSINNGYMDSLSIDRVNNDDGYNPSNCKWVTSVAQANNRRSNHYLTYDNETHNITEWASIKGINPKTLFNRIYTGWSIEKALNT